MSDIYTEEDDLAANMRLKYTMPMKRFVQAKGKDKSPTSDSAGSSNLKIKSVCGSKIKESYLRIVGKDSLQSCSNTSKDSRMVPKFHSKKKKSSIVSNFNVNTLMRAVESNDVGMISECIRMNKDMVLNANDQYGWSALMNACCAGASDVVELLLKYDPNLNVVDKQGNTCLSLAQSKRHNRIVELLEQHTNKSSEVFEIDDDSSDSVIESFHCDVCKETVDTKLAKSHLTSTLHLFNSSRKSGVPTSYGIPESNVGFQMLLKTGWDKEKGLGPDGSGHKFPPKTALKQDRTGLGAKKYISRVTHSSDLVFRDRSERQRTINRRERMRNEIKSKKKERELRRMLD